MSDRQRSLLILGIVEHPGLEQMQPERAKGGAKGEKEKVKCCGFLLPGSLSYLALVKGVALVFLHTMRMEFWNVAETLCMSLCNIFITKHLENGFPSWWKILTT